MKPTAHVIVSSSLAGLLWLYTRSFTVGMISFLGGLFLDADHIIEYIAQFGVKSFTFKKCYQVCVQTSRREGPEQLTKLHLIFHSLELAILFWLISVYTKSIYVFAFTLGYSVHLFLDCVGNRCWCFYFISWRTHKKFSTEKLLTNKQK